MRNQKFKNKGGDLSEKAVYSADDDCAERFAAICLLGIGYRSR